MKSYKCWWGTNRIRDDSLTIANHTIPNKLFDRHDGYFFIYMSFFQRDNNHNPPLFLNKMTLLSNDGRPTSNGELQLWVNWCRLL